tara:strand:+ start:98 stop:1012 length:915 start_codon:yes stop_codon:yes gene_type:complete
MTLKIRIATRKSELALRQVDIVKNYFGKDVETETIEVSTLGDKVLDKSLSEIGGKGLFIKELENFILNGLADIAVHSMKDMETILAQNTQISAVLPRGDRSDVLLGNYNSIDNLPNKAIVGTSSVRRTAFAKYRRPDLNIKLLRGNIGTRIEKLNAGLYDAIILAKAGLDRLNINAGNIIPNEIIPPASTQGVIAIQSTTKGNNEYQKQLRKFLNKINDERVFCETLAERSLLKTLDGSCRSPISASAHFIENKELILYGAIATLDGTKVIRSKIKGSVKDAIKLGEELGNEIKAKTDFDFLFK